MITLKTMIRYKLTQDIVPHSLKGWWLVTLYKKLLLYRDPAAQCWKLPLVVQHVSSLSSLDFIAGGRWLVTA